MTRSRDGGADVVVLTALSLEHDAVYAHLVDPAEHTDSDGTHYHVGVLRGGVCRVALAVIGEGNVAAAALTGRAIEEFAPAALLLVGIAGGLAADVALGDVVVATRVYAYQGGRAEPTGLRVRPRGWPMAHRLEQIARGVARTGAWAASLDATAAAGVRVHFKPLVSGDIVLDSRTGPVAGLIAENYGDAIAIDMESVGVAEAALRKDFYRAVTIRGVSDAAGGEKRRTDAQGWQRRAAAHAAAFAVSLAERIVAPAPAPRPGRPSETGPCPYRGLAAFRERDADLFFGRSDVADDLAGLVTRRRFVAVAGPSGSGKSSLLHAGLLPRLRPHGWAVAVLRPLPGVPAVKTLASGLLPLLRPDDAEAPPRRAELAGMIAAGRLPELVGEVLVETGATRLLVCVDQFEELDRASAPELAGLLAELATAVVPVHVVLTLRTEALDLVGRLDLGELARSSVFLLTPMRPDQLRVAIEAPAAPTGVTFEAGLVDRIVAAADGSPAALPLTQFALTRLWEEQEGPVLTHAVYAGFGGVEGALAGYAEQVWSTDLDDSDRVRARRLFVQLTRPAGGDGVIRRTALASELSADLLPVARRLAATRLVVEGADTGGEPVYDLAHAALATHWRRLREWLVEERDFRGWQEDLRESIRRAEPLRGPRLSHARRWLREHPDGITGAERAFVEASRRRHRRRTVAWRGGVALIAVLAVLASTSAVVLRQRTGELADQVRRNAAHALINEAAERVGSAPDTAALMTVAAYRAGSDPAILAHLAGEYLRFRSTRLLLRSELTYLRQVRMSADGRVVAAVGTGGGVVWRLDADPAKPWYVDSGLTAIAVSADGGLVAGVDGARQVVLWRLDGAKAVLGKVGDPLLGTPSLHFDGGSRRLLVAQPGEAPKVWDVQSRQPVPVPQAAVEAARRAGNFKVWFGPDGRSLVVQDGGGALTVWSLADGRKSTLIGSVEGQAAVSRDGRRAYTCAGPARVTWDLVALREARRDPVPGGQCPDLSYQRLDRTGSVILVGDPSDASGGLLVAGAPREGDDRHLRVRMSLVDPEKGTAAYPALPPNAGPVLAYDIATGLAGGSVRVASSAGSSVAVADLTPADFARPFVSPPLFDPQYRRAVLTSGPTLSMWDAGTGGMITEVPLRNGETFERFTADGRRLLTRVRDTHVLVRDVLKPDDARELDLPGGGKPSSFQPHGGLCVADTADPDTVAAVFAGFVSRFDVESGRQTGQVRLWRDEADRERLAGTGICAVRPGHDEIAFNTSQGVEVWNMGRGSLVARLAPLDPPTAIASVEFSADGKHLAVLGQDGTLDVWAVDDRRLVVDSLTVLPAGLLFASIVDVPAADRIIVRVGGVGLRIWDLDRRASITDVDVDSDRSQPAVSADGRTLLMWVRSAGLLTMPLEPERWAEHLCRLAARDLTDAERRTLPAGSPTGEICPR